MGTHLCENRRENKKQLDCKIIRYQTQLLFCFWYTCPMIYPNTTKRKRKHRNDSVSTQLRTKSYIDLVFEITCDAADYDSTWSSSITDEKLFKICLTFESTIRFAAREGWVCSKSPSCRKASCSSALDRSCYLQ